MLFRRSLIALSFTLLALGTADLAEAQVPGNGFASSFAVVGTTSGGVTTFGAAQLLQAGVATYHTNEGDGTRWGDYSATVRDPSAAGSFWTIQEFASGATTWFTQVTQLTVGSGGQVNVGRNFTSTTVSAFVVRPPDTDGAVGPNQYAHMLNSTFSVFAKTGSSSAPTFSETLTQFWVAAGDTVSTNGIFDPRIVYDKSSGRWFASSLDNAGGRNHFLVAVSSDSDPSHSWKMLAINSDPTGKYWADFDRLGVNADGVYLSGNMFALNGDPNDVKTSSLVIPKADLLAATSTAANVKLFGLTDPNQTGYSQQPVVDVGDVQGGSPEQFLSDGILTNAPNSLLRVSTLTGVGSAATSQCQRRPRDAAAGVHPAFQCAAAGQYRRPAGHLGRPVLQQRDPAGQRHLGRQRHRCQRQGGAAVVPDRREQLRPEAVGPYRRPQPLLLRRLHQRRQQRQRRDRLHRQRHGPRLGHP